MSSNFYHRPRHLYTVFLPVPPSLWVDVSRGIKTEYRLPRNHLRRLDLLKAPTPVVIYRTRQAKDAPREEWHFKLMVLEEAWEEYLGSISEESLEREGFSSLAEFRKDWQARYFHRGRFEPLKPVYCFRIRPWDETTDYERFANQFMHYLYEEFLP